MVSKSTNNPIKNHKNSKSCVHLNPFKISKNSKLYSDYLEIDKHKKYIIVDDYKLCYFCVFNQEIPDLIDQIQTTDSNRSSNYQKDSHIKLSFMNPVKINQFILKDLLNYSENDFLITIDIGRIEQISFDLNIDKQVEYELSIQYSIPEFLLNKNKSEESLCIRSLYTQIFGQFIRKNFKSIEKNLEFLSVMSVSDLNSIFLKKKILKSIVSIIEVNPRILFINCVFKILTLKIRFMTTNSIIPVQGNF
jgi:hypothetical protein